MNRDIISRKAVMQSITKEYNRKRTGDGLRLARIEKGVDDTPALDVPLWIPVYDGEGQMPEVDEDGYSEYLVLSFSNYDGLAVGQYREDGSGGAFYEGDEEKPLTEYGLFVNAWMDLKPYREE